ncbi:hypothetical protein AYL99_09985 [Fonsecaea erecta]|uniref:Dicer-like protein 2 n=1 Tax=Fonsecaea erecta TaxID=1367422 RepID=A0A178Z9H7_9EURO|nr:hypothetical protein AYL99_09985 [Fonsecaea erecta]OAP55833.1 hypothetical protein AYL99_09985 [Fonsecaea erecta]
MGSVGREYRPRGYQLEMLEQSLVQNIIAVMDTGSGKTQIAILRIQEELERCSQDKLVWFLAPTVALCTQQYEVMLSQLPAARIKLLLGADNVDRWSEQRIWDAALRGVRIVVSTHAVLLDALAHGFVQMTRLALLVFDEAHHCRKKHPANRIMEDFYHPQKQRSGPDSVPHILGLTASPIVKSNSKELESVFALRRALVEPPFNANSALERNLDATCRSPRVQRGEMLSFVHRPVLKTAMYKSVSLTAGPLQSPALWLLDRIGRGVTTHWDDLTAPDALDLGTRLSAGGQEEQLVRFKRRADHIYEELGPWAADYFILESVKALNESIHARYEYLLGFAPADKTWLIQVLGQIPSLMWSTTADAEDDVLVSPKAERLIRFLADQDAERCSGLVFVQQRATVSVLNALLSRHPQTKSKFRCTTFVGLSNSRKKRYSMAELLDLKAQREALTELRAQVKNLIIATDVLEEGIDVSACNLVVCFDVPSNFKSFLQRRGRARQEQSTFAILLDSKVENKDKLELWQQLEEEMIRLYQDETRRAQTGPVEDHEPEENIPFVISVPATGARLTADMTMGRLHHFCQKLPPQPYVDLRPAFETTQDPRTGLFTATVTLPNCISASVRQAQGCHAWQTQKTARKDAAFQAYQALFVAGLLNDHLLPLTDERPLAGDQVNPLPPLVPVNARFDPWIEQAKAWAAPDLHRTDIILQAQATDGTDGAAPVFQFSLTTPLVIPVIDEITMYCSQNMNFIVRLGESKKIGSLNHEILDDLRKTTNLLQRAVHSDRVPDTGDDFVALFAPKMNDTDVATWLSSNQGRRSALEHFKTQYPCRGFVRTSSLFGQPFGFCKWHVRETSPHESIVEVECTPLPQRRHFLRPETLSTDAAESRQTQRFPAKDATVDALEVLPALFGLFIPGVLQYLEVYLVAQKLCTTILRSVPVTNIGLVVTALSCPSAEWVTNYQRLEFVGDLVLKFIASWQLFLDHPSFHEGYLSYLRAKITSNDTLARAAIRTGLDAFIIAEVVRMGPNSYPRISTVGSVGSPANPRRSLSSKVLADVVEALIGAVYVDGGIEPAVACINTFLPDLRPAEPMSGVVESNRPEIGVPDLTNLVVQAEDIIRYRFRHKGLLLEALTHPTCERDVHTESYQRLEFLGDAVLDMLVGSHLAKLDATAGEMSRIKAAMVNGALLGFFCLELSTDEDVSDIEEDPFPRGEGTRCVFRTKKRRERRHLWAHMRFHGTEIAQARERSLERYHGLREAIRTSLATEPRYPWVELTLLKPEKFLSDMIESTIGAIFVDAQGDLAPCERFLERLGIWDYLRRVCAENVDTEHPKPALARLLAGSAVAAASVTYDTELERYDGPTGPPAEGDKLYRCTVRVDEEVLAVVRVCTASKGDAVTIAAEMARRELLARRRGNGTTADNATG